MRQLNLLATGAGMAAVFFSLVSLVVLIFFPPLPPVSTELPTPPTRTVTPTLTPTGTPTLTPSRTATPAPRVELLSFEYLQAGVGCQVDVTVNVNGEPLTGLFHVWNASSADLAGSVSEVEILPPGLSRGHFLTLEGAGPEFSRHEVWFEYEGGASNRLRELICPQPTP